MTPEWWQNAICYQIYPRSFADGNGDGIGDIPGITSKLDYLRSLGVTALWLSPFYPSPNVDWGYDVADYCAVDPDYGTLADIDRLIAEAHQRGIRIILDLVLNHTSDQHPWFQQAKSSRDNPYHDWFVWQPGNTDAPPNDWEALFGGSAWEYVPEVDRCYYHFFFKEQPDLNWRNPAVKAAMFDVVRFWLARGVDGFRLDALVCIYEAEGFPDTGVPGSLGDMFLDLRQGLFEAGGWETYVRKLRHQLNLPEVHPLMGELRQLIDEYGDRILLGETSEVAYYGDGTNEMHSVFNFDLVSKLEAPHLREALEDRFAALPPLAWEANTISNHDRPRSYTYFSDGVHDDARARLALALVMFLRGTPVIYYGEEIGMRDGDAPGVDKFNDTLAVWFYHALRGRGIAPEEAHHAAAHFLRDKCRTPMQWTDAPNAGFCPAGVEPWLPVPANYAEGVNVAAQESDPESMLAFFRQLAALRQAHPALRLGEVTLVPDTGDVLAFWRETAQETGQEAGGQRVLVALNMAAEPNPLAVDTSGYTGIYASASGSTRPDGTAAITLQPYEIWCGVAAAPTQ